MNTAWLLAALLATQPAAEPEQPTKRKILRIAVYDLESDTVDERVAKVVSESLLYELRKLGRTSVISFAEIQQMLNLEAEKAMVGCDSEDSCLSEIADALGADYLLAGTLAKVGKDHVFGLKVIDQRAAKAGATFNKIMPAGEGEEFLAEIGPAVEKLFPDIPLKDGETRGVSEEAARRLVPPPLPPIAFWSGVGVTGALLVGSAVAGGMQMLFQGQFKDIAERSLTQQESGAALVETGQLAQTSELVGWSLLVGGIVAGGFTAAMAPLTDFQGYGDE
jgi:TolB-like protein